MHLLSNEQVAELITTDEAISSMRYAFAAAGTGAQQARVRTSAGKVMLSSMGAVLPDAGITGAKIYTTINGMFRFVIVLFSTEDGRPLVALEADAMTGLRTAAATAVATDYFARDNAQTLSIIGTGVQARAHVPALLHVRPFKQIIVAGIDGQQRFADDIAHQTGLPARVCTIEEAVDAADVLITVTRATTPLFSGNLLQPGTFVAAVGASKATSRELDDESIARAAALVVEWKTQAQQEAGDLIQCAPGTFDWNNVWELGQALDGSMTYERQDNDIVIYKAVGIGLEDIALAGLAYCKARAQFGW